MKVWITVYRPLGFDYAKVDEAMMRNIDALNEEMVSAGVRDFVGGLRSTSEAQTIRLAPGNQTEANPGPYLADCSYADGFWVLDCADMAEAENWGRKAAVACQADIEVRPFH